MTRHKKQQSKKNGAFEKFAAHVTHFAGSTGAFIGACSVVLIWILTGPIFKYSDTWQLVINTGTTIITFLMVFLIQKSQNKDSIVIQIKLNELVAASDVASNQIISVEDLTEDELKVLHKFYSKLAQMTREEHDIKSSHSISEAEERHEAKIKMLKK